MSKLAQQLEAERQPRKTRLEDWIASLDGEDQAAIESARKDPELSNAAIIRVMTDAGYSPHKDTVAKWRRG